MKIIGTNRKSGLIILALTVLAGGCSWNKADRVKSNRLYSPYGREMTVAVVPVMNYSGNGAIDPLKVTDILYSELQQVEGFAVIPVNRLLAQMSQADLQVIETPEQALKLASQVGADMIVVAAITEYDPYYPPVVGLAVQLYAIPECTSLQASKIDPVAMARSASPLKIRVDIDPKYWPRNQVQRIYNARENLIAEKVKRFAECRGSGNSPYGWEVYLRSQEYYLRFVSYQAIAELLDREVERINPGAVIQSAEVKEYH
jgi:hypothetical protein